ncbi:hypothetical protein GM51_15510 [freshwater metagenome]|uniref:Right handed beta helix domain-containing protein n=1 Tax=freshwater metagenome TaxID=449393 RepID=A0A094PTT2_9ZZZZ
MKVVHGTRSLDVTRRKSLPRNAVKHFVHSATVIIVLLACSFATLACGPDESNARVVFVPSDYSTITEALDNAQPGTTIEIGPGVYHESLDVDVERITIRGTHRNDVVIDGRHQLANGFSVLANDVAIENLTVRNFLQNGIVFNGISAASQGTGVEPKVDYGIGDDVLVGYRVSYVTTHNNGLYGIYAFAARNGLIEYSLASGHPDSGIYIGQCRPCEVIITHVIAERNAIGYYGTNASGGVIIASSIFRHNRLGIAPNSQNMEKLAPQAEAIVVGNVVENNDDPAAPVIPYGYFGGGIAIGGGTRNQILRNRITGHDRAGIELLGLDTFMPTGNRIEGNELANNGVDLAYVVRGATNGGDNCFSSNTFTSSIPVDIERVLPCDAAARPFDIPAPLTLTAPPKVNYRDIPPPTDQSSMPVVTTRKPAGAGPSPVIEVSAIGLPT